MDEPPRLFAIEFQSLIALSDDAYRENDREAGARLYSTAAICERLEAIAVRLDEIAERLGRLAEDERQRFRQQKLG